jgi:hypothetical protein
LTAWKNRSALKSMVLLATLARRLAYTRFMYGGVARRCIDKNTVSRRLTSVNLKMPTTYEA